MAAIRAVQVVFPTADVKGCFFHYCQAKIQDLGVAVAYRGDPEVCKWIRRAVGLPLLTQNKIQDTWVDAMDSTPDVPGRTTTWKVFHNRLNRGLPHRHPNIYRFVEVVRKVEQAERAKILQLDFGAAPRGRKRVYREVENRLCRLKDELNREVKSPMHCLDAVGHLLRLG
ncbi:uncharacterized protein [Haliotis cracherodii]|uniref:uncharacterized protein n=1 Tax=Haliotis cracherodii TaxID=6455 RepID=UPI0039ED97E3